MQIIINMPEEQYNTIKSDLYNTFSAEMKIWGLGAIRNGVPLPKGHGRIIDESQVTGTFIWDNGYIECYAPTIIEADKEE